MQELIEREADLELALRHAVRNDELVIHLQPVVDLRSGEINGAEALVRWNRPGHGMVPPNDFIPIAESTGLGRIFVGALFNAIAMSLPELGTDVAAAASDAPDLAIGDLFGSSMANMAILAIVDLRYRG